MKAVLIMLFALSISIASTANDNDQVNFREAIFYYANANSPSESGNIGKIKCMDDNCSKLAIFTEQNSPLATVTRSQFMNAINKLEFSRSFRHTNDITHQFVVAAHHDERPGLPARAIGSALAISAFALEFLGYGYLGERISFSNTQLSLKTTTQVDSMIIGKFLITERIDAEVITNILYSLAGAERHSGCGQALKGIKTTMGF